MGQQEKTPEAESWEEEPKSSRHCGELWKEGEGAWEEGKPPQKDKDKGAGSCVLWWVGLGEGTPTGLCVISGVGRCE